MAFAPEDSPDPDEKGPGAIRQDRGEHRYRASALMPARMGTRCWSGGGREALSLP